MSEAFMTPEETAKYMGISVWTLAEWRCKGNGPKFVKFGSRVRYTTESIRDWVKEHTHAETMK